MTAVFVDFETAGLSLRGQVLHDRAPGAAAALQAALPLTAAAVHDQWSGQLFRIDASIQIDVRLPERPVAFQHPGLVVADATDGRLAVCYGQGRLQDGYGPLRALPLIQLGGDLAALVDFGHALQFKGATQVRLSASPDQISPLSSGPASGGRRMLVTLGEARATARLLEVESPHATASFIKLLPLVGQATNTHSSGPLVRFWNDAAGPEGETPLELGAAESGQVILYPGYLYYLPTPPWRGIRIAAREATVMKGAVGGGGSTRLVPLARLEGDWSAFSGVAATLSTSGARQLRFELA
jgi:hypothetical protein